MDAQAVTVPPSTAQTVFQNIVLSSLLIYSLSTAFRWTIDPFGPTTLMTLMSGLMSALVAIALIKVAGYRVKGVSAGVIFWFSGKAIIAAFVLGILGIIY
jgi:hypothetical protein